MIISHRKRFIFFAVPKTATHAVRHALRMQMGPDDLEQVAFINPRKFPFPELRDIRHGHISAREIRPVIGEDVFSSYFKFAFVRNPYDRFISYCAFMGRNGEFQAEPQRFMYWLVDQAKPPYPLLLRPQTDFLVDEDETLAMDCVGRTEHLQADYNRICARLGFTPTPLERVNASQHRDYRDYYDPPLQQWVAAFYARDFAMLGYKLDLHATEPA
jgi:Sulfotransferase family